MLLIINIQCNPVMKTLIFYKIFTLKFLSILLFALTITSFARAQKIENIYVDLYTDSLKKGTYNYININGKLSSGKYIPLDTTDIILTASDGKFSGNSLWLNPDFNKEKVLIKAVLKSNPALFQEFTMYIKKMPDNERLKTMDELIEEPKNTKSSQKRRK